MHDPTTMVASIKSPFPTIRPRRPSMADDARGRFHWQMRIFHKHRYISPFIYIGKYELYFHDILQIWHTDPKGDAGPACHGRKHWKIHIHHMSISPTFWYHFRQKHITRCAYCGKKSSKELGLVNYSNGQVVFHSECMSKQSKIYHAHDPRGCYGCSGKASFDFNRKNDISGIAHRLLSPKNKGSSA